MNYGTQMLNNNLDVIHYRTHFIAMFTALPWRVTEFSNCKSIEYTYLYRVDSRVPGNTQNLYSPYNPSPGACSLVLRIHQLSRRRARQAIHSTVNSPSTAHTAPPWMLGECPFQRANHRRLLLETEVWRGTLLDKTIQFAWKCGNGNYIRQEVVGRLRLNMEAESN